MACRSHAGEAALPALQVCGLERIPAVQGHFARLLGDEIFSETPDSRRTDWQANIFAMEVRSIEAIIRALNEARVEYLVVGGLAVNAHGYLRATRDIDLVIGLETENARRGMNALLAIGYRMAIPEPPELFADPIARDRWRREKRMIVLKLWSDAHRMTPVDIFIYEPLDFKAEYARADIVEIADNLTAPFVRLDALVAMKKAAARPQDLVDIEELLRGR